MEAMDTGQLVKQRAWLKQAEIDLMERVERRFVALGGAWHQNDPLYQRLWQALVRTRRELSAVDEACSIRAERAG